MINYTFILVFDGDGELSEDDGSEDKENAAPIPEKTEEVVISK